MTAEGESMNRHARDWLHARSIVATALREMVPNRPAEWYEQNAAAVIARLAQADPPLILARPEELAGAPAWTGTTPTEPGWYWFSAPTQPATVLEVYLYGPAGRVSVRCGSFCCSMDYHESHHPEGEWFGPLEVPT